jgi:sulfate transport system permease protein
MMYLGLVVLIPLSALFFKSATLGPRRFYEIVTRPDVMSAYRVSFGTSIAAAVVNVFFGLIVAWVLARYHFPGRRFLDALIDLPFALPTAVAGITLASLYSDNGWVGRLLVSANIRYPWFSLPAALHWYPPHVANTPIGIVIALIFIGMPFVVRAVQPIVQDLDREIEEAAASLGARRWQTFLRVIFPELWPALLTGFALSLARGLGEYGSVIFISGNLRMKTQIAPYLIIRKLWGEQDDAAATAIAVVMLVASLLMLLVINMLERRTTRRA